MVSSTPLTLWAALLVILRFVRGRRGSGGAHVSAELRVACLHGQVIADFIGLILKHFEPGFVVARLFGKASHQNPRLE